MNVTEFKNIIMSCRPQMLNVAFRMFGNDRDSALDAVQDTLIYLWEHRDRLDTLANAKAFCAVAVRNRCISEMRKRQSLSSIDDEDSHIGEVVASDKATDDKITIDHLYHAIDMLGPPHSHVMRLSVQGYNTPEIAVRLGLTEANVRQILSRSRKRLREKLTDINP